MCKRFNYRGELMKLRGYGKINLAFSVTGRMDNGYHSVKSMYQSISIFDEIAICKNSGGIHLECSDKSLPTDDKNIAYRAADMFFKSCKIAPCADIFIKKGIPLEAGLAGGSADGAAVLVGLNEIFSHPLDIEKMVEIGAKIGADVPFSIMGGTRLGTGIGDILSENIGLDSGYFVVAKPKFGNSTAEMFKRLDENFHPLNWDHIKMIKDIKNRDLKALGKEMCNCFEKYSNNSEIIYSLIDNLIDNGAIGASMTGSGSTVFGLFENSPDMSIISKSIPDMNMLEVCLPVPFGVEIIKK